MIKRLFDLLVCLSGLIIVSPVFILTAVMIKILTPGSVFFVQKRVGRNGKEFNLIKFRTMRPVSGESEGRFDAGDKSRITTLGAFLRKTKIDEWPQLINVLKGEMSIVGPRPEIKKWTMVYPEKWAIVHTVKPGITDNASVKFHNEEEILSSSSDPEATYRNVILPQKIDMYIGYVRNHTFRGDIVIIFKTIYTILFK